MQTATQSLLRILPALRVLDASGGAFVLGVSVCVVCDRTWLVDHVQWFVVWCGVACDEMMCDVM